MQNTFSLPGYQQSYCGYYSPYIFTLQSLSGAIPRYEWRDFGAISGFAPESRHFLYGQLARKTMKMA
jgi:hypothetical protein